MTVHPERSRYLLPALFAVVLVAGCGRTLVFSERDGVNFAIRADSTSTPPFEVNFGLDRVVATIVPPAGQANGSPNGDAVSMLGGFQVERFSPNTPGNVGVDLEIASQFASGAAATSVAGKPEVVARIVSLSGITVQRDAGFAGQTADLNALLDAIDKLQDAQVVAVATEMAPKLSERTDPTVLGLAGAIPRNRPFTPRNARAFLNRWASSETLTPEFAAEWRAALARARQ